MKHVHVQLSQWQALRYFEGMVDRLSSQEVCEGEADLEPDLMGHAFNR
jgi:hypothetical protein